MIDNITWPTHLLSIFLILVMAGCALWFIVALVRFVLKKASIKPVIITGILTLVFIAILCIVKANDYQIDRWSYDLRDDIMDAHSEVSGIDYSFGRADLSIFVDLDNISSNDSPKDISTSVFNSFADYFLNKDGINQSRNSWLKRDQGGKQNIQIIFYQKGREIISFESGYYIDGRQEEINNYQVWRMEYNGYAKEVVPPVLFDK